MGNEGLLGIVNGRLSIYRLAWIGTSWGFPIGIQWPPVGNEGFSYRRAQWSGLRGNSAIWRDSAILAMRNRRLWALVLTGSVRCLWSALQSAMSSMWGVPFSCCSFLPCWVEACGEVSSGLLVGGYLPFLWSSGEAVIRPTPISWGFPWDCLSRKMCPVVRPLPHWKTYPGFTSPPGLKYIKRSTFLSSTYINWAFNWATSGTARLGMMGDEVLPGIRNGWLSMGNW